jgi:hypothetical protein
MDSRANWTARFEQTFTGPAAAAAELAAEHGDTAAQRRARITEMNATLAGITRRVLVIAQRRTAAHRGRCP